MIGTKFVVRCYNRLLIYNGTLNLICTNQCFVSTDFLTRDKLLILNIVFTVSSGSLVYVILIIFQEKFC